MKYLYIFFFLILGFHGFALENNNLVYGKKLFIEKKYIDAKIYFEKYLVFNPKNSEGFLYLAKIFKELKNINEEEKNLNTVLLLDPKNDEALYLLIDLYIQKGDFKVANEKYELLKKTCTQCGEILKIKKKLENYDK